MGPSSRIARSIYPQYLDPVSANQINQDPYRTMNVHALMVFHGQVTIEGVRTEIVNMFDVFSRFKERVVKSSWKWPYWQAVEDFKIEDHVTEDAAETDMDQLHQMVDKQMIIGCDPDKPLWKVVLYTNVRREDGSVHSKKKLRCMYDITDPFYLRFPSRSIIKRISLGCTDTACSDRSTFKIRSAEWTLSFGCISRIPHT